MPNHRQHTDDQSSSGDESDNNRFHFINANNQLNLRNPILQPEGVDFFNPDLIGQIQALDLDTNDTQDQGSQDHDVVMEDAQPPVDDKAQVDSVNENNNQEKPAEDDEEAKAKKLAFDIYDYVIKLLQTWYKWRVESMRAVYKEIIKQTTDPQSFSPEGNLEVYRMALLTVPQEYLPNPFRPTYYSSAESIVRIYIDTAYQLYKESRGRYMAYTTPFQTDGTASNHLHGCTCDQCNRDSGEDQIISEVSYWNMDEGARQLIARMDMGLPFPHDEIRGYRYYDTGDYSDDEDDDDDSDESDDDDDEDDDQSNHDESTNDESDVDVDDYDEEDYEFDDEDEESAVPSYYNQDDQDFDDEDWATNNTASRGFESGSSRATYHQRLYRGPGSTGLRLPRRPLPNSRTMRNRFNRRNQQ